MKFLNVCSEIHNIIICMKSKYTCIGRFNTASIKIINFMHTLRDKDIITMSLTSFSEHTVCFDILAFGVKTNGLNTELEASGVAVNQ